MWLCLLCYCAFFILVTFIAFLSSTYQHIVCTSLTLVRLILVILKDTCVCVCVCVCPQTENAFVPVFPSFIHSFAQANVKHRSQYTTLWVERQGFLKDTCVEFLVNKIIVVHPSVLLTDLWKYSTCNCSSLIYEIAMIYKTLTS